MHDSSRAGTSFCLERSRKRFRLPSLRCATAATRGAGALEFEHLIAFNCRCLSASGTPSARLFVALNIMSRVGLANACSKKLALAPPPARCACRQQADGTPTGASRGLLTFTRFEHLFLGVFARLSAPDSGVFLSPFLHSFQDDVPNSPAMNFHHWFTAFCRQHLPYVM